MPVQGPCSCLAFSSPPLPIFSAFAANSLLRQNAESDPSPPASQQSKGSLLIPCVPTLCTQCTPLFSRVRLVQLSWRVEQLPCSLAGVSVISAADQRHWVMQLGFPGRRRGALMPPHLCTCCCLPPPCILIGLNCGGAGSHELSGILLLPVTGTWMMLEKQPWLLGCVWDRPVRGGAGVGSGMGRVQPCSALGTAGGTMDGGGTVPKARMVPEGCMATEGMQGCRRGTRTQKGAWGQAGG